MSKKFYESIEDMPIYNWHKCISGDYYYVRLDEKQKELPECEVAFKKIYESYFKIFGIDKRYKEQLEIIKKIAMLQCDYLQTKDEFKFTQIEIENAKLEMLNKSNSSGTTLQTTLIYLSKWLGYRLDWKQVSVYEYYTLLEEGSKMTQNG
jgi:hypothetical protein